MYIKRNILNLIAVITLIHATTPVTANAKQNTIVIETFYLIPSTFGVYSGNVGREYDLTTGTWGGREDVNIGGRGWTLQTADLARYLRYNGIIVDKSTGLLATSVAPPPRQTDCDGPEDPGSSYTIKRKNLDTTPGVHQGTIEISWDAQPSGCYLLVKLEDDTNEARYGQYTQSALGRN